MSKKDRATNKVLHCIVKALLADQHGNYSGKTTSEDQNSSTNSQRNHMLGYEK